jgi:cell division protein FtsL
MSVRVNLLPETIRQQERQRRANLLLVLLVVVFLAALGFVWFLKQGSVDRAVETRDAAQAEVNSLQAQVNALGAFQALADELAAGNALLTTAMGDEIAVARVLNDVSLSLPGTSSLTALTLSRDDAVPAAGEVDLGDTVANLLLSGYSIERYAPGVEGVLLQFDQVSGLDLTYLNTAALAEIATVGVTSFDANGLLNDAIYTNRYAEGLPEVQQ